MAVGTAGAGRIGTAVLHRLKAFDVKLHYTDRHRLSAGVQQELNATFHPTAESLVRVCDVVTINTPLPTDAIVEGLEVASGGTYDLLNVLARSNGGLRLIVDEATRVVPVLREGETSLVAS